MQRAVEYFGAQDAVEFGTGSVLTGLLKRINSSIARKQAGSIGEINALC
jgi:malonyl CoA-acyl carrier protein transacylase